VAFGGVVEAVDQLGALFFPAHKGGTLGQVMGTGFLLGGRGPGDLDELPAIVKALGPKPAAVDELGFGNFARELFDDASDQDLVALGPGCHPRRGVDGGAEEVTVLLTTSPLFSPIRTWTPRSGFLWLFSWIAFWIATAQATALRADAKATMNPSPSALTSRPAWASIWWRTRSL